MLVLLWKCVCRGLGVVVSLSTRCVSASVVASLLRVSVRMQGKSQDINVYVPKYSWQTLLRMCTLLPKCVEPICVEPACVEPICVEPICVEPICVL